MSSIICNTAANFENPNLAELNAYQSVTGFTFEPTNVCDSLTPVALGILQKLLRGGDEPLSAQTRSEYLSFLNNETLTPTWRLLALDRLLADADKRIFGSPENQAPSAFVKTGYALLQSLDASVTPFASRFICETLHAEALLHGDVIGANDIIPVYGALAELGEIAQATENYLSYLNTYPDQAIWAAIKLGTVTGGTDIMNAIITEKKAGTITASLHSPRTDSLAASPTDAMNPTTLLLSLFLRGKSYAVTPEDLVLVRNYLQTADVKQAMLLTQNSLLRAPNAALRQVGADYRESQKWTIHY